MPELNVYNHQKVIRSVRRSLWETAFRTACKALSEVLRLAKKGSDLHGA